LKIWILFLALVFSWSAYGREIVMDYAQVGAECGLRSRIVEAAIRGHNGRSSKQETTDYIRKDVGPVLKEPQATQFIKQTIDHVYAVVPVTDSFQVGREYTQLCIENPDQYIRGVSITNWDVVPKR